MVFRLCFWFAVSTNQEYVFTHHEPLSNWLFPLLKTLPFSFFKLSLVLSAALTFIQALLVNRIVSNNKVTVKKNYAAGVLFIIFASFFKENLLLSPASVALTFIILCTARIFSLTKKEKSNGDVFDVGFLVAVATLFYFPCVLFFVFAYIGMGTVRAFNYREWTIALLGFLSPFFVLFVFYFWSDKTYLMLHDMLNFHDNGWMLRIPFKFVDWLLIGSLVFISLAWLTMLPSALYSSLIQVRKFSTALVSMLLFIGIAFTLQQTISFSHFVLLALPLSVLGAMVLTQIRNAFVTEVIHLILILLVLAGQFLPVLNII
jgi:hypothetical protein